MQDFFKYWKAAAIVLVLGSVPFAAIQCSRQNVSADPVTAPFQKTDRWVDWAGNLPEGTDKDRLESIDPSIPEEKKSGIFIRVDSSGKLLLKHNYGEGVYSYSPETKTIGESTEDDWKKSQGEITVCRLQMPGDFNSKLSFKTYPDYKVISNGKALAAKGKYALFATESPTRSRAAILSGSGPLSKPGPGPLGLGGAGPVVHGEFYVQVFDLSGQTFIGPTVKLQDASQKENYNLCWSNDERYIVVYKPYENFSIVETGIALP